MQYFGSMTLHAFRAALLTLALATTGPATAQTCPANQPVFADEFSGTALDLAKWEVMIGDGCIGPRALPFDAPRFMILNIAIGGYHGGEVDDRIFPVSMEVEYVRVYQKRP
jgi:beta-glucanase (GH16 family)